MAKMPKRKRMAVGGKPGESARARAEASRSTSSSSSPRDGGFAGAGRSGGGSDRKPRERPTVSPFRSGKGTPASGMDSWEVRSNKNYPTVNRSGKGNPQGSVTGKDPARLKKGGMVKNKMKKGK